jgi:hypothetical protein
MPELAPIRFAKLSVHGASVTPGMISRKSFVFGERRVSALVRRYAEDRGFPFISVRQPQHLFRKDDRKHARVGMPGDPWQAVISTERFLGEPYYGIGATPDDAVLAAIPRDLVSALRRCEIAVDSLRDCLQK